MNFDRLKEITTCGPLSAEYEFIMYNSTNTSVTCEDGTPRTKYDNCT
jgi:hypothetical protein